MKKTYKFYFDKPFDFILNEELLINKEFIAIQRARKRFRMYANLWTRGVRKILITNTSSCCFCGGTNKLVIDHIIPITKGGKNELSNTQILCNSCNIKKSNKL